MPVKTLVTLLVLVTLLAVFAACVPPAEPTPTVGAFGTPGGTPTVGLETPTSAAGGAVETATALIGGGAATVAP